MHGTWNQYSTWQRTGDAGLFARQVIGHEVNSSCIRHGRLGPAVSRAVPETSCSQEGLLGGERLASEAAGETNTLLGWVEERFNAAFNTLISISVNKD